ncbi:MAG: hypothetical protein ACYDCQ_19185 [Dehalococcoidia bacterium]
MHPWNAEYFEWDPPWKDDGNTAKLLRRGIRDWEVEQVFLNDPDRHRDRNAAPGDYYMNGKTDASRRLTIVVVVLEDDRALRAISGWGPEHRQRPRRRG